MEIASCIKLHQPVGHTLLVLTSQLFLCAGMNACIGVGQLQQARQLLSDMAAQGLRPDVKAFNILLKGHSKVGDVQAIDSLLREMQQAGVEPSPATIGTVVNAYVQVGQLSTAKSSLADAQRKGEHAGSGLPA